MITLYGLDLEIFQAILMVYVFGYGITLGLRNTAHRVLSLFKGKYSQSSLGKILDALWYGCIFVLVGSLV